MEQPVTVAIIEDHPVVTEGVASWIRSDPGQRVRLVRTAHDLTGFRAALPPPADVVILDLELSGELVTTQIPGLVAAGYRVVAFSGHSDPAIVVETLDNGAHTYVSKEEGRDHLVEAVLATAATSLGGTPRHCEPPLLVQSAASRFEKRRPPLKA